MLPSGSKGVRARHTAQAYPPLNQPGSPRCVLPPAVLHSEGFLRKELVLLGSQSRFDGGKEHALFPSDMVFERLPEFAGTLGELIDQHGDDVVLGLHLGKHLSSERTEQALLFGEMVRKL